MSLEAKFIKKFEGFTLDISFSMQNELLVFFGHSGAGKSVTLKLLAGLLAPDKGFIKLNNEILLDTEKAISVKPQERSIGYVFQNHSIFPHMTVLENILFGAKGINSSEALAKANEMMGTFNLVGLEKKYPHEISGGQKQRVALAMNLIRRPKALLLDEPFSALDTPLRMKMRECLKDVMKRFQIPIILVTHDENEAQDLGERILYFKEGSLIESSK